VQSGKSSPQPDGLTGHRGASSKRVASEVGDAVSLDTSERVDRTLILDVQSSPEGGKRRVVKIGYSCLAMSCDAYVAVLHSFEIGSPR